MSKDSQALVYRGAVWGGERRGHALAVGAGAPGPRVGIWDLSLILGDLPALVEEATPHLFTVTAPVPAGVVAPGPCLVESRLLPHALRVARGLWLDWLIVLTPYPLATPGCPVCVDGPVSIVSVASEATGRLSARRALAAAKKALPPEAAAALNPFLKRVGSRSRS